MKTRMKRKSKVLHLTHNILVALASFAFPLLVFDLLLKSLRLETQGASRQMFLVSSYISNQNSLKYRHYTPSSAPTHITVVNDRIEHQYQFRTDKLGFRTTYNCTKYASTDRFISIHGDSFTEGQGVTEPWIVSLQKSACSNKFDSVNMAMPGNGISDFQSTINLANRLFPGAPIVLAVIDHDFFREPYNVKAEDKCSRYYTDDPEENNCLSAKVKWTHIDAIAEIPDQLKIAKSQKVYGLIPFTQSALRKLKSNLDQSYNFSYSLNKQIYKKSITALAGYLRNNSAPVLLIRLPMQKEILNAESRVEHISNLTDLAHAFPNTLFLDLGKICPLTANHFFDNDPHPNQLGHNKLSRCLKNSDEYLRFVNQLRT